MPRRSPTHRKRSLRVFDGKVDFNNYWGVDLGDYRTHIQSEVHIHRRDPGPGRRHLLTVAHIREFTELLPDWDEIADALDAIVLDHDPKLLGWYQGLVIGLCSWERDLWWPSCSPRFFAELRESLDLIGVEYAKRGGVYEIRWTEDQVRAFQLLTTFMHEVGHMMDALSGRRPGASRGEPFAERYAQRRMHELWPAYARRFPV
jgi:hypothetical protein